MDFYTIRLKRHPHLFIGKKNCSYAITCDDDIKSRKAKSVDEAIGANYWFTEEKYAKVWTRTTSIKWLFTYASRGYDNPTFSEYELLKNGEVISIDGLTKKT